MKGFLNKVQTKVTGVKAGGEGKGGGVDGVAAASAAAKAEATPRVDISLPRRHDRR
jgi:hypothetical protein